MRAGSRAQAGQQHGRRFDVVSPFGERYCAAKESSRLGDAQKPWAA